MNTLPGASDKRCLLRLSELSQCFKRGRRENATLSEHLREAWDGEPIHVPNRKSNALSASDYAVSVYGDVTPGVLRKTLETGTESVDGFANRFLWAALRSDTNDLPHGGNINGLKLYLNRLQSALAFVKNAGEMKRDADADRLWEGVYSSLKRSGDSIPHTDRARPYVVRLSMLYALADQSQSIKVEHLKAAFAVWDYCRQSARLLFSDGENNEKGGEQTLLALRVADAIAKAPGINRKGLHQAMGGHVRADALGEALAWVRAQGLAHPRQCRGEGAGRPSECWYPDPEPTPPNDGDDDGDSDASELINSASAIPSPSPELIRSLDLFADASAAADALAQADAGVNSFARTVANAKADADAQAIVPETQTPLIIQPQADAHAQAPALPAAEALAQANAHSDALGVHCGHITLTGALPIQEGENMTLEQFRAEAQARLGRWDDPDPAYCGKRKCFPSEEAQLRWYLRIRKADDERKEQKRLADEQAKSLPLTPEDAAFLAEIDEIEKAMAMEKAKSNGVKA